MGKSRGGLSLPRGTKGDSGPISAMQVILKSTSALMLIPAPLKLFLALLLISLVASVGARFAVLQGFISGANLAHGFFVPDAVTFHELASEKAREIRKEGWGAWQLRPSGQFAAGMASILYVFTGASPWAVLGLNACLHACAGCLLFMILRRIFPFFPAMAGCLLFTVHPATLEWTANLHRDGIFILGNFLFLLGLLGLYEQLQGKTRMAWFGTLGLLNLGFLLVWFSRSYFTEVLLAVFVVFSLSLPLCRLRRSGRSYLDAAEAIGIFVGVAVFNTVLVWCFLGWGQRNVQHHELYKELKPAPLISSNPPFAVTELKPAPLISSNPPFAVTEPWIRTPFLPEWVDQKLFSLAQCRNGSLSGGGNSLVDTQRQIRSFLDLLLFFPRAAQIGLFSPLPSLWGGEGSNPAYGVGRRLMSWLAPLQWFLLAGWVLVIWRQGRKVEIWLVLVFALLSITVLAYAFANIGTLLRIRYGYFSLLMCCGLAGWVEAFQKMTGGRVMKAGARYPEAFSLSLKKKGKKP